MMVGEMNLFFLMVEL